MPLRWQRTKLSLNRMPNAKPNLKRRVPRRFNRSSKIVIVDGIQFITFSKHNHLHMELAAMYGKADHCVNKPCYGNSGKFEWSLKRGRHYSNSISDYQQLCVSCHRFYDRQNLKKKRHKLCFRPFDEAKKYLNPPRNIRYEEDLIAMGVKPLPPKYKLY